MDERFYRATMKIGGGTLLGRLAFSFLVICSIAVGGAIGLLFVYSSDLPEIHALENYRPVIVTELYADDGQSIGTFALQRRILLTYSQIPPVLRDAIITTEDQHFEQHWGVDFPRVLEAAWRDVASHRAAEGASTLTMQLAGGLFLNRSDRSLHRKLQETMLALQIERHYTKDQIFTMYCNQIYLGAGNYGFEAASEYYFSKPVGQLTLAEAATLAAIIRGPIYSPIIHPERARARRNLVLSLLAHGGKITDAVAESTAKEPLGLHVESLRNDLAPYFVEEIRHGWRGNLPNILRDNLGTLDNYQNDDWKGAIQKGDYVTGLVTSVQPTFAYIKIGPYRALLTPADFAWTAHKSAAELVKPGDLVTVQIDELNGTAAEVELEQVPVAQAALIAIDNATGGIKAMVGGYDFEDSKFDRATQAMRQTGSSFKVYVYAEALAQGATPFDTVVDEPVTFHTGSQDYSPHNYDEKFEGRITLRRALADSRNVPAVRLLAKVGIENTVELARKFGLTSPLPPVLPLALGAADLTLIEHTSAFTVFPDDGIHIEPHYLRRVTSYDGVVMEELRPTITDVIPPDVARTMVAMLEDVVQFGTGVRAKEIGRPSGGKTGTTNDFTDAWYIGFTPQITTGVWVGNDAHVTLGKKETGARAALPIWIQFMEQGMQGMPVENFRNVVPLEKIAGTHPVQVDTPDTAPPADAAEQGLTQEPAAEPPPSPPAQKPTAAPQPQAAAPAQTH
jgi:penicillin-binding protein 1A